MAVNTVRMIVHLAMSDHLNKYLDSSEDSSEEPSDPIQDIVLPEQVCWNYNDPTAHNILKSVSETSQLQ